jgi:hypothetical protein
MHLFIFKTNVKSKQNVSSLTSCFNTIPSIMNWTVDVHDIDKVLRIEAHEMLTEQEIINLMQIQGFYCETLND